LERLWKSAKKMEAEELEQKPAKKQASVRRRKRA